MTDPILTTFQFSLLQQALALEGLALSENAREAFELRIQRFARHHGFSIEQLLYLLDQNESLRIALAEHILVHESYFYREIHHLNALTSQVLPGRANCPTRPISILSAGCASGEEAYSIRIAILEALPRLSPQVEICGLDRSEPMINAAKAGCYSSHALREMPENLVEKYFDHEASGLFPLKSIVRESVTFYQSDLLKEPLEWERYDIIFCRNVMMYLTMDARKKLESTFGKALKPGGVLFPGTTESFSSQSPEFRRSQFGKAFFYQKEGECS